MRRLPASFAIVHCTRTVTEDPLEKFMPTAVPRPIAENDLAALCREAMAGLDALLADATAKLRERVVEAGRVSAACSIASSAPRTGWPGWRPTSKRCASSAPTPSG